MKILNLILLAGLISQLLACASMSKEECMTANWRNIGYEDGIAGRPEMTIQAHRKACAKIHITPDLPLYQQGHREGVRVYCKNTSAAYELGTQGGAYYKVCPADLEPKFLQAYRLGQELFNIQQKINDAESHISSLESSIENLEQQKRDQEDALMDLRSPSKSEKRQYLEQIDRLADDIYRYRDEINQANRDIGFLESEYAHRQEEHRRMGY